VPDRESDLLTRTTLQFDGTIADATLAPMIRALQRVPGVLLAEVNPATARALVAHDAAVPATSLIAAAQNVGVRVRIVGGATPAAAAGHALSRRSVLGNRRLLVAASLAFLALAIVDALVPNTPPKHWILIVLTAAVWVFFITKSLTAALTPSPPARRTIEKDE
jgi:hypothetical protein